MKYFNCLLICLLINILGKAYITSKIPANSLTKPKRTSQIINQITLRATPPQNKLDPSSDSNPFDSIKKAGLAGILAITLAEAIFWALGYPAALLYYKLTANEWIDVFSADGAYKAAGFSVGYGGFATAVLQYRVTIAAIPLIPLMDKYVVPLILKFNKDADSKIDKGTSVKIDTSKKNLSSKTSKVLKSDKRDFTWGGRPNPTPEMQPPEDNNFFSGKWRFGKK